LDAPPPTAGIEREASAAEPIPDRAWRIGPALLLVAAGALVYHGSLGAPFIVDDPGAIVDNHQLRQLWPPATLRDTALAGRPIVALSFQLNFALHGLEVRGYHLVNIALHLLNALLLFGLARRTLARCRVQQPALVAFAGSLLWLLHPLQTEAVTYIVQRTELLVGSFFLLTFYCFLRGVEAAARGQRAAWHCVAAISCALGMASKEVMVVCPLLLLAYDRIFLGDSFRSLARARWWVHGAMALCWLVLLALIAEGPRHASAGIHFSTLTPAAYLRTQAAVILHYLRLAVWPHPLVLDYDDWPVAWQWRDAIPAGLGVLALLAATAAALRYRPRLGFLGLWFFAVLAPTSSVLPIVTELAAERRMYLPLAVITMGVALAAASLVRRVAAHRTSRALAGGLALTACASVLGVLAAARIQDYRTDERIYRDTVIKRPRNARALQNLAVAVLDRHRPDEALVYLARANALRPTAPGVHAALGIALAQKGALGQARHHLELALRIYPGHAAAYNTHNHLASVLAQQNDLTTALAHFRESLRLRPDNADTHGNLGLALARRGDLEGAIAEASEAARLAPGAAQHAVNLAAVLQQAGRLGDALAAIERALRLAPESAAAHAQRGGILARLHRVEEARRSYERAVALGPSDFDARNNLGVVLASLGRLDDAIAQLTAALRLRPDDRRAHLNLALVLHRAGRVREAEEHLARSRRARH
jgi:Flp pilus assembly protein TadD